MNLRYYQKDALEAAVQGAHEHQKQLIVMPTGSGKTILFSKLAERALPGRSLVLVDKQILADQACEKIEQSISVLPGREQGEHRADAKHSIVVSTVQSMVNRLGRWPRDHFAQVICDEAHCVLADSWQACVSHFDKHAKIFGFTATPFRGDKKNLGRYFDNIAYEISLRRLIHDGYLSPIKVKALPVQIDISNVSSVAGDFHSGRLHDSLTPRLHKIADAIKEHASGRKILAFLPLIETSRQFAQICNSVGLKAQHVSSQEREKDTLLKHFKSCDGGLMSNAMILSTGYDNPKIDCVVVLRPTRSTPLYCQMVGRGTRTAPGKEYLLVLDFLWHHERHNLVRPANLLSETSDVAEIMTQHSFDVGGEVDLLELEASAVEQRRRSLEEEIRANERRKAKVVNPVEFHLALGDVGAAQYVPTVAWESEPPTSKQLKLLEKFKIDSAQVESKGHAHKLISRLMPRMINKLASPKQLIHLRRMGYQNPETATFTQARDFLSRMWGKR